MRFKCMFIRKSIFWWNKKKMYLCVNKQIKYQYILYDVDF